MSVPLAEPDHLTHADLMQAARVLLWRYQDGAHIEWHQQRIYGNDHLRTFLDRSPDARFEPVYRLRELWLWTTLSIMLSIAPVLGGLYCVHATGS